MDGKKILIAAAAAFAAIQAFSQNLNPTVEITNAFEGKLLESDKQTVKMDVPDSLLKFDLEYDYSVFSTRYGGGYDFAPYLMDMRPEADSYRGRRMYLKASAGYALNPVVDFVWSPVEKRSFKLDVFASTDSYYGDYRNICAVPQGGGAADFSLVPVTDGSVQASPYAEDCTSGYDFSSRAGFSSRYDWKSGALSFGAQWRGLNTKSMWTATNWNSASADFRVFSKNVPQKKFVYDLSVSYSHGQDDFRQLSGDAPYSCVMTNDIGLSGFVGHSAGANRLLVAFGLNLHDYGKLFDAQVLDWYLLPKYVIESRNAFLSLGVRIPFISSSGDSALLGSRGIQGIYPDIHASYTIVRDCLNVYADVTGGETVNSYAALKERYHFLNPSYPGNAGTLLDNSDEKFHIRGGFRGNIASVFRFDAAAGYSTVSNGFMESVTGASLTGNYADGLLPCVSYSDYQRVYAGFKAGYDRKPVSVDLAFLWNHTILADGATGIAPSAFTGSARVGYNYNERIKVYVYGAFASKREGRPNPLLPASEDLSTASVPGYFDLGLYAEYVVNRNFSVFLRGANLLNASIQRVPLYAERGISASAGLVWQL
ncbi:MAG: hypothetical protein ACI4AE_07765 [Candidatus Cryptobacteroides sp.]